MKFIFKNKIILILGVLIFLTGCGYKSTTTQTRDTSYIKFNKNINKKFIVEVNNKYKFELNACIVNENTGHCYDATKDNLYKVKSGNNNIKVYDTNNNLILDKDIYIGSDNTVEIDL